MRRSVEAQNGYRQNTWAHGTAVLPILVGLLLMVSGGLVAAKAAAQDSTEAIAQLASEGDFREAYDEAHRVLAGDGLDGDQVARLLEIQAYAAFALQRDDLLGPVVRQLALVAPRYAFDPTTPPGVVQMHADLVASPAAVQARAQVQGRSLRLSADAPALEEVTGLVRDLRVHARAPGAEWQEGSRELRLDLTDEVVQYYAEAIGPGGMLLATDGNAGQPLEWAPDAGDGSGDGVPAWVWIAGTAVVALIAVGVIVAATSSDSSEDTRVVLPSFPP